MGLSTHWVVGMTWGRGNGKSEIEKEKEERERSPILLRTKAVGWKWRHLSHALFPSLPFSFSFTLSQMKWGFRSHNSSQIYQRVRAHTHIHVHKHMHKKARQLGLIRWGDKRMHTRFFYTTQIDKHSLMWSPSPVCLYSVLIFLSPRSCFIHFLCLFLHSVHTLSHLFSLTFLLGSDHRCFFFNTMTAKMSQMAKLFGI